eukprot:Rhum_TRINITY_DN14401_c6_g1::Rhum_TRINITY_DN14401_c6_g1_i1::g.87371::m.87371
MTHSCYLPLLASLAALCLADAPAAAAAHDAQAWRGTWTVTVTSSVTRAAQAAAGAAAKHTLLSQATHAGVAVEDSLLHEGTEVVASVPEGAGPGKAGWVVRVRADGTLSVEEEHVAEAAAAAGGDDEDDTAAAAFHDSPLDDELGDVGVNAEDEFAEDEAAEGVHGGGGSGGGSGGVVDVGDHVLFSLSLARASGRVESGCPAYKDSWYTAAVTERDGVPQSLVLVVAAGGGGGGASEATTVVFARADKAESLFEKVYPAYAPTVACAVFFLVSQLLQDYLK